MKKTSLVNLKNNAALQSYFRKPSFLSIEDEKKLLLYIENNELESFYQHGASLIKNSYDVINLYLYIFDKAEKKGIKNQILKNQVHWRMFKSSCIGLLDVYDMEVITYCRNNTDDPELLEEMKEITGCSWYHDYVKILHLEHKIDRAVGDICDYVTRYLDFLEQLYEEKHIDEIKYGKTCKVIRRQLTISRDQQPIGSLVTEELQERLQSENIIPYVTIQKGTIYVLEAVSNK